MDNYHDIAICHTCDLVHHRIELKVGTSAHCSRCGSRLYGAYAVSIKQSLALSLASTVLFLASHLLPFLEIATNGLHGEIHLISIIGVLYDADDLLLAIIASLFLLFAPLSVLLIHTLLLSRIFRQDCEKHSLTLMRWASRIAPWNILEIFFVGVIVAMVKLSAMTEVTLHMGFWLFAGLVVTTLYTNIILHEDDLWESIEEC